MSVMIRHDWSFCCDSTSNEAQYVVLCGERHDWDADCRRATRFESLTAARDFARLYEPYACYFDFIDADTGAPIVEGSRHISYLTEVVE